MNIRIKMSLLLTVIALMVASVGCNDEKVPPRQTSTSDQEGVIELLQTKAPEAQTFKKNADNVMEFSTQGGLQFTFYQYSLYDKDGNPATGDIDIEVTEYLSNADMILGGITTGSDDRLLKSGGMFNIQISQNGSPLKLRGQYKVNIPTSGGVDPDMRIFRGEETINANGDREVNWLESNDSSWVTDDSLKRETYELFINFLNWCNLDKFYGNTNGAQVRVKIPEGYTNRNTTAFMIFSERSVVYLISDKDKEEFNSYKYNLPIGWKIKILVITNKDDKLGYALVDSEVVQGHLETITSFTEISKEDLETLIKTL